MRWSQSVGVSAREPATKLATRRLTKSATRRSRVYPSWPALDPVRILFLLTKFWSVPQENYGVPLNAIRQLTLRYSFVPSMGVARRARHAKKFSHRSSSHEGQKAVSSSALSVQRVMVHVRPFPHPPTRVGSGPPTRTSPGAFLAWALSYSPALHLNVCASSCALRLWLRQPRGRRRRNIPVLEVMTASARPP